MQHPAGEACSLSLAIAGVPSEAAQYLRYGIGEDPTHNHNDTTQLK